MAVSEVQSKVVVRMQLENGSSSTGKVLTVPVSLGTLKVSDYDNQKAMNIINALSPMFSKSLYIVEKVGTAELEEG